MKGGLLAGVGGLFAQEQFDAEVDQVGATGDFQCQVQRWRGGEQRFDPQPAGQTPEDGARGDT